MHHDDRDLDAMIDEIARPEPPRGHAGRVLARTGPAVAGPGHAAGRLRLGWLAPIAAGVLVVAAVTWQSTSVSLLLPAADAEPRLRVLDRPVLPPEAYWAMSPFEEFARLQATAPRRDRHAAARPAVIPSAPLTLSQTLDPIALTPIDPAPLEMAPLAAPAAITLDAITFEPIDVVPSNAQETP